MAELNEEILNFLEANTSFDSLEYAEKNQLDHQKVVGAIKSLQINEGVRCRLKYFYILFIKLNFYSQR